MKKAFLVLIGFYQKFLTLFSYGSCRYYPTCSEYAREQIIHNNIFLALFLSFLRILRCNQFFRGGIDYPVVKKEFPKISFVCNPNRSFFKISFWFVPKDNKSFYIVKSF